jgi:hypothetical protein
MVTSGQWFRGVNAVLGVWLIISTFLWPHTRAQQLNAFLVGGLAIVFTVAAVLVTPKARYLNAALGVWLFISA